MVEGSAKDMSEILKTCSCGKAYTWETWRDLPCIGTMAGLELRNCSCNSTISARHSTSWSKQETLVREGASKYHLKHILDQAPPEDESKYLTGTLFHMGVLEPERFASEVVEAPHVPKNRTAGQVAWLALETGKDIVQGPTEHASTKAWEVWAKDNGYEKNENGRWVSETSIAIVPKAYDQAWAWLDALRGAEGKMTATPFEIARVSRMVDAVFKNEIAREIFDGTGKAEVEVHWTEHIEDVEIEMWAHVDYARPLSTADLKSSHKPRIRGFTRSVDDFGYAKQGAIYAGGAHPRIYPDAPKCETHYLVAVDTEPPHDVCLYQLDEDYLNHGWKQYQHSLRTLARLLKSGDWRPDESKAIHMIHPEPYMLNRGIGYETMETD